MKLPSIKELQKQHDGKSVGQIKTEIEIARGIV